ncbi:Eco57I restriction-modification methylase domain-containing protein [Aquimarina latercula]|uniref:Eco57I restriction-modification methylase domain-containing protein n=1 Tax=Aquimarina latercula TaxID=987 RepID=UPI000415F625|nr:SAM-dependent methyltransferase [Aquimarina latercula]
MRITKSYNETPKGIQLEFDPELSNTDLKKYLISIGFKNANRNKGVWYIRGVRPSFDKYTSALENANKEGKDLLVVKIEPSYEVVRGNIDHKLFSLVTASIENEDQDIKDKDYVVFEDFRVSAEDIAIRFLKSQFGDKFKGLKVTAKNLKERARNAFDEERIISNVPEGKKTVLKKENVVQDEPVWNKTKAVYLSEISGNKISSDQLIDPDVLADEKHEHKIAILTALRNGKDIPESVLQDYPSLSRSENFQFGFDSTDFKTSKAFLELLKGIGNTGNFVEGAMVNGGRSGYLWEGNNLKIVTANNPLVSKGKTSFIGIEGFREQVLDLVNLIEGQTNSRGELGLDYISFSDYDFSKPIQPISLTNEGGVYTRETAGERLEVLEISFPESVRVEASITVVQDEEGYYLNGLEFFNRIGSGSNNQFRPKRGSTRYNSKKEAIRRLLELIAKNLNTELIIATTIKATEKLKAVQSALLSLKEFAAGQGIELSIEDIKLGNDKSVEEKEETKAPHSDIKRATVQSMIEKLTDLEIDTEGETETIIATLRLELEEALQIENEVTFLDKVEHAIIDQKDWINDIEPEAVRNTFLDLILSNAAALGYTPFTVPHSSGFLLEQAWTKLDTKTVKNFEEFINSNPDLIEHKYYPEESEPNGYGIKSDRDEISFQVLEKNRIAISSHKPFKEGVIYGGSTMSSTKLKKAIRYIISNPIKVVSNENAKDTEAEKENPVITDITRYGTTISNVLTPHRVIALFNSGLYIKDAKKIQEFAPYLLEASDDNLSELSAKELFELVQMAHPNDYGFSVTRSAMLREWERRGKELFEEIGFPTDPNYLYVNLNRGYRSVYPLQNIIDEDRETQSWWHAAAMYRPIADLERALEIIQEEKADFKKQQLVHTNPKTGKPKSKKEDKGLYRDIEYKIEDLDNSKELIEGYIEDQKKKETAKESEIPKQIEKSLVEEFFFIKPSEVEQIRKKFGLRGFTMDFTGKQAFIENVTVFELGYRYELNKFKLDEKTEKEFNKWIAFLEKEIEKLNDKEDKKSKSSKAHREERILDLKQEARELAELVEKEDKIFRDELFFEFVVRAKDYGYVMDRDDIANFRDFILNNLFGGRIAENYPDEPIGKIARILIDDFFATAENEEEKKSWNPDYLDKVVAIMHDHYIKNERLSKKKIEAVKEEAGAPNLGALWEAVELSWLLWYKQIYNLPIPFDQRLTKMVEFWNTVQPTYAYSDSSKELFKQYSTPCPIGAMVAEYTQMSNATRIFEPSAGNGLLVLGADPEKAHVNEIDKSRRYSLELQRFETITHLNAAEPFPEELTRFFDVMVTNPPFASWDDSKFDKERWTQKYFNNQIGVAQHMRLEHFMAGLALHTLKGTGKAAIIIMGHVYFGQDGYIEKYKPFFNWLYRHYKVDDIINMNSYKLYNKQGAVAKTMLILINGRKSTPEGVAPTKKENPAIEQMVNSFPELWERINSHIKTEEYTLEVIITQLKIELGL